MRVDAAGVLFRVAGGPRLGFGHVTRALTLARAMRVPARLSLRGGAAARAAARRLGARLDGCDRPAALDRRVAQLLVVDDPSARAAAPWVRAARAHDLAVASVHDLGLAPVPSHLAIDGSLRQVRRRWPSDRHLCGPAYAVLDPALRRLRRTRDSLHRAAPRIVVGLGGGPRGRLALRLGLRIKRRLPRAVVAVSPGLGGGVRAWPRALERVAPDSFRAELAGASIAVVAGGVTLAEAGVLGIPAVAVAVVRAQRPAVRIAAAQGLALDGGFTGDRGWEEAVAAGVQTLAEQPALRAAVRRAGPAHLDGRGAERVAAALRQLARTVPARGTAR